MSYFTRVSQDSVIDVSNNSSTNLAAGATFTGTAAPTVAYASIQIILKATVATGACTCTVYIEQGDATGTHWDVTDQYEYISTKNFALSVTAVSELYRVRVTNNSSTTTNVFRLVSVIRPITSTLPRSVTNKQNLKTSINELSDSYGFPGQFSPVGALQTSQPFRMAGMPFSNGLDTNFWTVTNGGGLGAATTVSGGVATTTAGTATGATGWSLLQSKQSSIFLDANPNKFRAIIQLTAVTAPNNLRRAWGPVTMTGNVPQNGCFFAVDATGLLTLNTVSNGSISSTVASGNLNGDRAQFILDTNQHQYEIIYITSGAYFLIDGILIHTFIPTSAILYQTLNTPISVWSVNNTAVVGPTSIVCWGATILRLGRDVTRPVSWFGQRVGANLSANLKLGPGVIHSITFSNIKNNSVVTLYDNTTASGTVIWSSGVFDKPVQSNNFPFTLNISGVYFTALSIALTGADISAFVIYE